ncbi:MAG: toxic anion resistance protein [Ruthenibacterium sp.]
MESNTTPDLTLDANTTENPAQTIAAAAASVSDAKATLAAVGVPTAPGLTLEPLAAEEPAAQTKAAPAAAVLDDSTLSADEKKAVDDFSEKIDLTNSTQVLQYGAASQKKVADFSSAALENVRTKDLGEVGGMVTSLVSELKGFDASTESKGIFGFFKKSANQLDVLKMRYDKAETNVEKIEGMLQDHQVTLLKDIAMLDKMYEMNLVYFKELTMYILAGKKKLAEVRANELPAAVSKAKKSNLPEDAQAAKDLDDLCNRFEKKLYDLALTRNISVQMSPQIRLIQSNDTMMAEKIQTSIVNTIPLWKSQMVLALGLAHSQQAIDAQRAVTDMTNELLQKNAAALKQGTIQAAQESERGIVDIETLTRTNQSLIETLDEVVKIQTEGKAKRAAAEVELGRIEGELKAKLLNIAE